MAEIRLEKSKWRKFCDKYPQISEFLVFFIISNGVTVLQMILMPLIKYLFSFTDLVNTAFQVLPIGQNLDGSRYYVFDYAAGSISQGGGGGMAYFLAVEITLFVPFFVYEAKLTKSIPYDGGSEYLKIEMLCQQEDKSIYVLNMKEILDYLAANMLHIPE